MCLSIGQGSVSILCKELSYVSKGQLSCYFSIIGMRSVRHLLGLLVPAYYATNIRYGQWDELSS